jgi:hypothetical protein
MVIDSARLSLLLLTYVQHQHACFCSSRGTNRSVDEARPVAMQVMYLKGIQYIYNFNIFLYIFLIMAVLSVIFMIVRGPKQWKRKKVEDAYNYS